MDLAKHVVSLFFIVIIQDFLEMLSLVRCNFPLPVGILTDCTKILLVSSGTPRYSIMLITFSKSPSLKLSPFVNLVEIALGSSSF